MPNTSRGSTEGTSSRVNAVQADSFASTPPLLRMHHPRFQRESTPSTQKMFRTQYLQLRFSRTHIQRQHPLLQWIGPRSASQFPSGRHSPLRHHPRFGATYLLSSPLLRRIPTQIHSSPYSTAPHVIVIKAAAAIFIVISLRHFNDSPMSFPNTASVMLMTNTTTTIIVTIGHPRRYSGPSH